MTTPTMTMEHPHLADDQLSHHWTCPWSPRAARDGLENLDDELGGLLSTTANRNPQVKTPCAVSWVHRGVDGVVCTRTHVGAVWTGPGVVSLCLTHPRPMPYPSSYSFCLCQQRCNVTHTSDDDNGDTHTSSMTMRQWGDSERTGNGQVGGAPTTQPL